MEDAWTLLNYSRSIDKTIGSIASISLSSNWHNYFNFDRRLLQQIQGVRGSAKLCNY